MLIIKSAYKRQTVP